MSRLRFAIARWIYETVACIHRREPIGVQNYEIKPAGTEVTIPMTSVLRRCSRCNDTDNCILAGRWTLDEVRGQQIEPPSWVAEKLIDASFKKGPAS